MFILRDKKGAAHFEMIISFVLFLGFVIFLLVFLKPTSQEILPESVSDSFYWSFFENTKTEYTELFLRVERPQPSQNDYFYIDLDREFFEFEHLDSGAVLRDVSGSLIENSYFDSNNFRIYLNDDSVFYEVVFADEVNNGNSVASGDLAEEVRLGSIFEKEIISDVKLKLIEQEYNSDYDGLKRKLNFPESFDFAITSDGYIEMVDIIPDNVNVIAKEYIEEVLFLDGVVENKKFVLRVW